QAASDAGILMVAAAGNSGLDRVSWPAASPLVMTVAGAELTNDGSIYNSMKLATYSNISGAVDLVAPAGNLGTDVDNDGHPDGIIAETINPADPTDVGYWLMSGTSQATAQVSGLAVELLRAGISAEQAELVMKYKAESAEADEGRGSGFADMDWGVPEDRPALEQYYVALLPFLSGDSDDLRPKARVTVFTSDGQPAEDVEVVGSIWGNGDGIVDCDTDASGTCFLQGAKIDRFDADGQEVKIAWSIAVESIEMNSGDFDDKTFRPKAALTHTPAFDAVVAALQADPATTGAMLAWSFSDSNDPDLGEVADSFSIIDSGSGLASIPLGLVMSKPVIEDLGDPTTGTLGVSGEQIPVTLLNLDGSGLKSIPLGFTMDPDADEDPPQVVFIDGSGLKSIPLGVTPEDVHGDGDPVPLDDPGEVLSGTALGSVLADGGWTIEGYGAATVLGSSTELGLQPALTENAMAVDGVYLGAVCLDDAVAGLTPEAESLVDQHLAD
ncbi:MAG: S8 family serine peptidase, partial [Myxococcota bacterium]